MSGITLSVIVVSRHRTAALLRCIRGLALQDYPLIEVIVVADPAAQSALASQDIGIKSVVFDEANISAARNAGLGLAAGQVVAFIDDDAVAEPTWASRLVAPFANPDVIAATGFVRGRNGVTYQWKASQVDATGQDHPLAVPEGRVSLHAGSPTLAVKTQGTNCAFRADDLRAIGGFDPAFRFFLDEADVNLRLAGRGVTAIVPLAQVHHGFEASDRRRHDRVPLNLFDIGASTAVFQRRHNRGQLDVVWSRLLAEQRRRLIAHMVAGRIEPRDVSRLLSGLRRGWAEGTARDLDALSPMVIGGSPFSLLPGLGPRSGCAIAGRIWQSKALIAQAQAFAAQGKIVTLFLFTPGFRRHRHGFTSDGIWLQIGGLWGKADRDAPTPFPCGARQRVRAEVERVAQFRPVGV